jgi:hypothetical protein
VSKGGGEAEKMEGMSVSVVNGERRGAVKVKQVNSQPAAATKMKSKGGVRDVCELYPRGNLGFGGRQEADSAHGPIMQKLIASVGDTRRMFTRSWGKINSLSPAREKTLTIIFLE